MCQFARTSTLVAVVTALGLTRAESATWRVGDAGQPWRLYPVSFLLDRGETFKSDYIWGGAHGMEVVVDDDGDGLIDEDPVDLVDNDADGLINEDPADGKDNDRDGQVDEDGPDPQFDNDGDGLLNEDGLWTGGVIYDPALRKEYTLAPFFRHETPEEAALDPQGGGWGWGDDDYDVATNEDPRDGIDNDGDGLVDEDPAGAQAALPDTWTRSTFSYDAPAMTMAQRRSLAFRWDETASMYVAESAQGEVITAVASQRRFAPSDWLRPIRLDAMRNIVRLTEDRFLSGVFGSLDATGTNRWGYGRVGTAHGTDTGYGQIADGNIFSARSVTNRSSASNYFVHFRAMVSVNLIRLRPRPDFPDRTPASFRILYAGDKEQHFQQRFYQGELETRIVVTEPIIPRQVDQARPPVKEYRFVESGPFGPPPKVRILNLLDDSPEGRSWEMAEFEAYGFGYALDGAFVTEIIDVGSSRPRFRRYFDPADPERPIAFEHLKTLDDDGDEEISADELASTKAGEQFDTKLTGKPVTWGQVRWHGQVEGEDADVQVRVRSGTVLDTHIYQRRVGGGVLSPYMDRPILADWPAPGSRVDAFSYAQMPGLERAPAKLLPLNALTDRDGIPGGWTPWSAPFDFSQGIVERDGSGGVPLRLPPLHRYIQFRFDFDATETSGVSLDYLEFEFSEPVVSRQILAEIFPDTATALGVPTRYEYVLRPSLATADLGFNRIDISVPAAQSRIDTMLVDDLTWEKVVPVPPADLSDAQGEVWVRQRLASRAWLDTVTLTQSRSYASATFFDSIAGEHKLGIKTRVLRAADFPQGQDREIRVVLTTPLFRLLTAFDSWVWNDAAGRLLLQPTQPGNASDRLPSDAVQVTVQGTDEMIHLDRVSPNPFTPNNDGVNDRTAWQLDLFLLTSPADLSVTLYSLSGQSVRKLETVAGAGVHTLTWDGTDEAGNLVPPGIYLYRLFVNSDTEESRREIGTIAVTY